ncbi:protease inhibitor I42 family protein [Pseudochryseolinea flava]|uniref:Proteinase inhibitor I42 chagasin domain-containing protein n=1 Tax=Pseudochryseolinea flava TaxID=2059302 RepID=A0A364Y680_9BACT|nr:protease inhibitor I42 family protein [Pseudochryseolinea flava]RAW01608.1 hypothetical protein DQQ10_08095 [Pseudochryseolinea flava]
MKRLSIGVALILLIALTTYTILSQRYYDAGEGDTFTLRVGETFSVRTHLNGSTGYHNCWVNRKNAKVIETSRSYQSGLNEKLGLIGSGGVETISFQAIASGTDTVYISSIPPSRGECGGDQCIEVDFPIKHVFIVEVVSKP